MGQKKIGINERAWNTTERDIYQSEKANMRQVKVIINGKGKCTSASAPVRSGIYEMTAIFEDNSIYLTD